MLFVLTKVTIAMIAVVGGTESDVYLYLTCDLQILLTALFVTLFTATLPVVTALTVQPISITVRILYGCTVHRRHTVCGGCVAGDSRHPAVHNACTAGTFDLYQLC